MDSEPPPVEIDVAAAINQSVHTLVAFWLEGVAYGLYVALFVFAIQIMTRKQAPDTFASRFFLAGVIVMFILITIHIGSVVHKMLRAYAQYIDAPPGDPGVYFFDYGKWDNYAHPVILALLTWISDTLVIYRCFLIWRRNYLVIVVPMIFLAVSIVTTCVNLYWFKFPESIPWTIMEHFLNAIFPVNLVQNVLTTGLISYKIWRQYQDTKTTGLALSNATDLLTVVRIVVESASIYTIQTIAMMILFYTRHPGLVIVQHLLCPSMGIVFVLIAVRTHVTKVESAIRAYQSGGSAMYPSWMGSMMMNHEERRRTTGHSMPIVTTVTEEHRLDVMSPTKLDHENSTSTWSGGELRKKGGSISA